MSTTALINQLITDLDSGRANGTIYTYGQIQRRLRAIVAAEVVRTVAELDALPVGSVILNRGLAWQLTPMSERMSRGGWLCADRVYPGVYNSEYAASVLIPATVLWTPEEAGDERAVRAH